MVFIPNDDSISGWWQTNFFYEYDSLNRLSLVREVQNEQNQWIQDFDYDRWGNRTINAAGTQVFGASPTYSIPEPQFTINAANNRLSPPSGYTMSYDAAGNLTTDTYTGSGARAYDAEGRMTTAQFLSGQVQTAAYAYDADGRRVKRDAGAAAEVWQVYGMEGELLAEYAANASPSSPRKEYGYRGGELLVTLDAPQSGGQVHDAVSGFSATQNPSGAWAYGYRPASGGSFTAYASAPSLYGAGAKTWAASATSCCPMATKNVTTSDYVYAGAPSIVQPPHLLNLHPGPNGERSVVRWTAPAAGSYVVSGRFQGLDTAGTTTDVLVRHNSTTLFSGSVTGYGSQAPFSTSVTVAAGDTIEFSVGRGANATYANDSTGLTASVVPAAAVGAPRWLVSDHLGTPRMVVDRTGSLSGVTRHDYLPFGEELAAGVAGRTTGLGYASDGVRQQFTGYERDAETGLDYAQARYFAGVQGRFTSVDPLLASGQPASPQTWNRYSYALNNPLRLVDPTGMRAEQTDEGAPQARPSPAQQPRRKTAPPPVDLRKDPTINKRLDQIREAGKPLAKGETPVLSGIEPIVGETSYVENGSYIDGYGNTATNFTGVVRPVAYVPLDQGGNIIPEGNGIGIGEVVKVLEGNRPATTDQAVPAPEGGVPIDIHSLATSEPRSVIQQRVFVVQVNRSGEMTAAFTTGVNKVTKDAKAKTVQVQLGTTQRATLPR